MQHITRWLKFWCEGCKFKTPHEYLAGIETSHLSSEGKWTGGDGLAWRCERCHRVTEKTAHQASTAERP